MVSSDLHQSGFARLVKTHEDLSFKYINQIVLPYFLKCLKQLYCSQSKIQISYQGPQDLTRFHRYFLFSIVTQYCPPLSPRSSHADLLSVPGIYQSFNKSRLKKKLVFKLCWNNCVSICILKISLNLYITP